MLTDVRRWMSSDVKSVHDLSWPGGLISTTVHIIIYKTPQRKLDIELHEHLQNTGEYNMHAKAKLIKHITI